MESHQLDQLIEAILASPKYKSVSSDLVRYIGTQELAKGHNLKEAIKATKNKLHQVGGAYQDSAPRYRAWLDKLKQASQTENRKELLAVYRLDRKSTRLNSSHQIISYAVFCFIQTT